MVKAKESGSFSKAIRLGQQILVYDLRKIFNEKRLARMIMGDYKLEMVILILLKDQSLKFLSQIIVVAADGTIRVFIVCDFHSVRNDLDV